MGLIQTYRQGTGSGGGGLTITGFYTDELEQTTNFISGAVVIPLTHTPISVGGIQVGYSGAGLLSSDTWSYAAGSITILFADPYVTDYDAPPFFQITYPY